MKLVDVPHVLTIVTACWHEAEANVIEQLEYATNSDEDFITKLFHLEFSKQLNRSATNGAISKAFIQDLKSALPDIDMYCLEQRYSGLIAEVSLHRPRKRKNNGAGSRNTVAEAFGCLQ